MNLDQAIRKHTEWKLTLRAAICAKDRINDTTLSRDDCCELGKWLHGEAKVRYANFTSYVDCVDRHAAFHREAGKVAVAINAGRYTEAEAMLSADKMFAIASSGVGVAIMRLRRDAGV